MTAQITIAKKLEMLTPDLKRRAASVAEVAAMHAPAVDQDARFPSESIDAARQMRLMGPMIPTAFGGEGAGIADIVDICYMLSRSCASTGMIYAMHQIMIACLVRHGVRNPWQDALQRRIVAQQLLLASSTTDAKGGGDLRNSTCAIEHHGADVSLIKSATVMSYGAHADGLLVTARRTPDAASSDQSLLALTKEQYGLEHLVDWDALGMRGTCSAGFTLNARGTNEQILDGSYQLINARTVMPVAHLTWSAVWAGIAAGAVDRARKFVRGVARNAAGQLPPGAVHLPRALATLQTLRGQVASAVQRFEAAGDNGEQLEAVDFQSGLTLLKVSASELAISTVMSALQATGLSGYRNDTEFSVGRHLRDVLSSSIMINNDRILANAVASSLLTGAPERLRD